MLTYASTILMTHTHKYVHSVVKLMYENKVLVQCELLKTKYIADKQM